MYHVPQIVRTMLAMKGIPLSAVGQMTGVQTDVLQTYLAGRAGSLLDDQTKAAIAAVAGLRPNGTPESDRLHLLRGTDAELAAISSVLGDTLVIRLASSSRFQRGLEVYAIQNREPGVATRYLFLRKRRPFARALALESIKGATWAKNSSYSLEVDQDLYARIQTGLVSMVDFDEIFMADAPSWSDLKLMARNANIGRRAIAEMIRSAASGEAVSFAAAGVTASEPVRAAEPKPARQVFESTAASLDDVLSRVSLPELTDVVEAPPATARIIPMEHLLRRQSAA